MMRDFNTNATCNLQQMSTLVSLSVLSGLVVKYYIHPATCNLQPKSHNTNKYVNILIII